MVERFAYNEAAQWVDRPLPTEQSIIVDGLDELALTNRAKKQLLLDKIGDWLKKRSAKPGIQVIIATRLGTWSQADSKKIEGNPKILRVELAYLSSDDVKTLARDLGIDDPEKFALRGPGSVCGLYPYEVEIFTKTRTDFSGSWQAIARALLEASFASTEHHVQTLTLEKWSLGLCRLTAAACLMGRQSFALDVRSLRSDTLQVWRLLPDYTPAEHVEVLSSSFFGQKASSVYQLREGKLTYLLAALWCAERLARGTDPKLCKLWIEDPATGRRHVPMRLRALLGWIGSSVQYLQRSLTSENPDIWLWGGDFNYVLNQQRTAVLAYNRMLQVADEENFLPRIEDAQLHAVAPYVAPEVTVAEDMPLAVLKLTFRIRLAANLLTAAEAIAVLPNLFRLNPFGAHEFDASTATSLLSAFGKMTEEDLCQIRAWADQTKHEPLRLFVSLGTSDRSLSSTVTQLISHKSVFTSNGRSENYLRFIVDKLVGVDLPHLFNLISGETMTDERYTLLPYLSERMIERGHIVDRDAFVRVLVEVQLHPQQSEHEFSRPGMFDVDEKDRLFPGGRIRHLLENDPSLRESFWQRLVEVLAEHPGVLGATQKLLFVDVRRSDMTLLEGATSSMPSGDLKKRIIQLRAEMDAEAANADSNNQPLIDYLCSEPVAALGKVFIKECKNDYWWISYDPVLLEKRFGAKVMPHIKVAAGRAWRSFARPLKVSSGQADDLLDLPEESRDVDVYLAAMDLETQLSEQLELSPAEVATALNLASWAHRSFPSWLWDVQKSSPDAARILESILMTAVEKLWNSDDASPRILKQTLLGVLGRTLGSIVARLLEERPPLCQELHREAVWLLHHVDDPMQVRRIIARRELDMPEARFLWIDFLADLNWSQAEDRIVNRLKSGDSFDKLPRSLEKMLRERPESLRPSTLLLVAQRLHSERSASDQPDVHHRSAWNGCIHGLMHNEVDDPRHCFERVLELTLSDVEDDGVKPWMLARARDSWASNSCRFVDEGQILDLERGDERPPITLGDLWNLVQRHICILTDEAEAGDFSCVQMFSTIELYRQSLRSVRTKTDPRRWEFLVQLWFAEQMRLIGRGLYHIAREEEVWINSERIDISACAGNLRVPIEIKLIDYSLQALRKTVRFQLLERYMKPPGVRFGILLIVKTHDKSYRDKGPLDLESVVKYVQEYAQEILLGQDKTILVHGIDLTTTSVAGGERPPAQKKSGKKSGKKRSKSAQTTRPRANAR